MSVISFANPKGGAGKTTAALLLASEVSTRGASVAIIDADPEKWISKWAELPEKPDNISIYNDVSEDNIVDIIELASQKYQFIIVDLEGTASLMVANAIGMSDIVLVPTQGASMDARGAAKTIKLIQNQQRLARRNIQHYILLNRTSAAITSRALRSVLEQLKQANIPILPTAIVERAAFRDIFDYGGSLSSLDERLTSNLAKAMENSKQFTNNVLAILQSQEMDLKNVS